MGEKPKIFDTREGMLQILRDASVELEKNESAPDAHGIIQKKPTTGESTRKKPSPEFLESGRGMEALLKKARQDLAAEPVEKEYKPTAKGSEAGGETELKKRLEVVNELRKELRSKDNEKRISAIRNIGLLKLREFLIILESLAEDPTTNDDTRREARQAIEKLTQAGEGEAPEKKKEVVGISEDERKKLIGHIQTILQDFDFIDYFQKEDGGFLGEHYGDIKESISSNREQIMQELINFLIEKKGEEDVKKLIAENQLPKLEFFDTKLQDIALYYYLEYKNELELAEIEAESTEGKAKVDEDLKNLKDYDDKVLEGVAEVLEQARKEKERDNLKKELSLKIEFEEAVDKNINEILQKIELVGRKKLERSGINLSALDEEIKEIEGDGRARIIKQCLIYSKEAENAGKNRAEKITFWADYFAENAFKYLGGDDLRKAYRKAYPRHYEKIGKTAPAKLISKPVEHVDAKKLEETITINQILISEELRSLGKRIEEYLLEQLEKERDADSRKSGLIEEEKKVLDEFLKVEYREKFVPAGSPDTQKAADVFVESIVQSIENKLKKR